MLAALALALAVVLIAAPTASADHHLMKVNELSLSSGGNPSAQFVELKDDFNEPFPNTNLPYQLAVFDGSGAPVGSPQDLGNPFMTRDNTQPFLIASAASGLPGDATLALTLPQGAGQVCFASGTFGRVHCVAYGCPATRLSSTGGSQAGLAPADGQSLQRIGSSLALGAPTPKATNTGGGPATCPAGLGGPGGGGAGGAGGAGDSAAPKLTLSAKGRQRVTKLALAVRLNEAARLTVSATVNVPGGSRVLRFKTVKRQLKAGVRTTVKLKLSAKNAARVKLALRARRKLTAKVSLRATDSAGNRSKLARKSIRLR
jgi:hypothetical protein